jgi:hypothetical protein
MLRTRVGLSTLDGAFRCTERAISLCNNHTAVKISPALQPRGTPPIGRLLLESQVSDSS